MDMKNKGMFSSKTDNWSTPQDLFDKLNAEFDFQLDVAADDTNHKCESYFTKECSGLDVDWDLFKAPRAFAWMNPPYGREIKKWIAKASKYNCVALLPARTDTSWFHDYIYGKTEIRFIRGRLKFGGATNSAPFPSMVVVFRGPRE